MTDQTTLHKTMTDHSVPLGQETSKGPQSELSMNSQGEYNPTNSTKKNNSTMVVLSILLGGLVTMLVGFGSTAFFMLNRNNTETPVATPEVETQVQPDVQAEPNKETTIIERSLEKTREIAPERPNPEVFEGTTTEGPDARSQDILPDTRAESDPQLNSAPQVDSEPLEEIPSSEEALIPEDDILPE